MRENGVAEVSVLQLIRTEMKMRENGVAEVSVLQLIRTEMKVRSLDPPAADRTAGVCVNAVP